MSGNVTYQGKSLPQGVINFTSKGGESVMSSPIRDGAYRIENVPKGDVQVSISTPPEPAAPPPGVPAAATGGAVISIPAKFAQADQSGLTVQIKGGEQKENFDLK